MKTFSLKLIIFFVLAASISLNAQAKEIIAYYPEWGVEDLRYIVKDIEKRGDADKLTTIMYAFSYPAPDSLKEIVPMFMDAFHAYAQAYSAQMSVDGAADDTLSQALRGQFNQLRKLKARHPNLKVLMSIGGWTGSVWFSDAALTEASREKFVNAVIDRFILGNLPLLSGAGGKGAAAGVFDGIDIDWEYPVSGGNEGIHNNKGDKNNFSEMLKLFRKKLDAVRPGLLLTAAVPAQKKILVNYNIKTDQDYLDWYNVMTYDFRSSWSKITGHHTNLFSTYGPALPDGMQESLDHSVRYYRDTLNVAPNKIVPGAAFYGRGWITFDTINCGLYRKGKAANADGGYSYYYVLSELSQKGYCYKWDNIAMAPILFSHKEKTFWSYDDEKSAALKSRYVDAYKLRGIMFWEISGDDSRGSLLNAIYTGNMSEEKASDSTALKGTSFEVKEIKITSPVNSQKVKEGSSVVITTDAERYADRIRKVEFFADNKLLGFDIHAPFSWAWFNVPKGKHELKAVATLSGGRQVESGRIFFQAE